MDKKSKEESKNGGKYHHGQENFFTGISTIFKEEISFLYNTKCKGGLIKKIPQV